MNCRSSFSYTKLSCSYPTLSPSPSLFSQIHSKSLSVHGPRCLPSIGLVNMDSRMEPLEELFRKVEEESKRRAELESQGIDSPSEPMLTDAANTQTNRSGSSGERRRGGSISVTRFGQLVPSSKRNSQSSVGPLSPIASKLPFYQTQLANDSSDSFMSESNQTENEDDPPIEEDQHITQVYTVTGRHSFTKAMNEFLPRRLSKSVSEQVVPYSPRDSNVVIGVSVEEATVEVNEDSEEPAGATVYAPNSVRNRSSRLTLPGSSNSTGAAWAAKAKDITTKIRQRSKSVFSAPGVSHS
ncbi:hypothetical protein AX17_006140 [Amanita inopinata Kibby_2008]|nr:hypothetical protein AX17_006140 [Amanita inopinata Kibby_2008]